MVQYYDDVFGPFEAKINMGPVQPPQPKGRVPQYARDKLLELQQKFDDLESQGVFARPESLGLTVEYLNPSFLVKKSSSGRDQARGRLGRKSHPRGRNFALNGTQGEVGVSLKRKNMISFCHHTDASCGDIIRQSTTTALCFSFH